MERKRKLDQLCTDMFFLSDLGVSVKSRCLSFQWCLSCLSILVYCIRASQFTLCDIQSATNQQPSSIIRFVSKCWDPPIPDLQEGPSLGFGTGELGGLFTDERLEFPIAVAGRIIGSRGHQISEAINAAHWGETLGDASMHLHK